MFIASVFPVWGLVVTCIVALFFFIAVSWAFAADNQGFAVSVGAGLFSSTFSALLLIVIFAMLVAPFSQQTFSNPHNEPNLTNLVNFNKEGLNNTIAETIEADKVSIDLNGTRNAFRDMKDGVIFDFTAIDDGSKITGSFYFTEDSLEIIVENEQQVEQEYSINTNE